MIADSPLALFEKWIRTREQARIGKESGAPWPWTDDPAINENHFCNVRREDDRVTKELRAVVLKHDLPEDILPSVYTLARLFNHAPSLDALLSEGSWGTTASRFSDLMMQGIKVFNTAYVVSTCGQRVPKPQYCVGVACAVAATYVPRTSLAAAYSALRAVPGLGSFMAGQVVADLKNDRYLSDAEDWWTWSCIGPGSKKGLDILFGGGTTAKNYEERIEHLFHSLSVDIRAMNLHMQDLQNCLCEFSKYMRIITGGKGRKRIYHVEH